MQERIVAETTTGGNNRDAMARKAELFTSTLLRGGVLLSASVIVIGVLMFYVRRSLFGTDAHPFPHTLGAVFTGLAQGDAQSVIVLGLLVLLMTPVMRVAISIIAFALEYDWRYVVITSIVLFVLLLSFFLGRGGA